MSGEFGGINRRGIRNGAAKLTVAKVRAIRRDHRPFFNTAQLAKKYKINKRTVTAIANGETWGWVE